jgi:putative GTP pyrophosphokinase
MAIQNIQLGISNQNPKPEIDTILAKFDEKKPTLEAFCLKTEGLLEASLQEANIRYHSVSSRVKDRKKLETKFQDSTKNYEDLDDITDLAGLRVITYYGDDIDRIAKIIEKEFSIDKENSVDKRDTEPDRFSYHALHFVCSHLEKRTSDVEYRKFAGIRCEIQITSILRHAWSEMEHEWYDLPKEAYEKDVKKRFYRLAALLDLAESEFLDIRIKRDKHKSIVDILVEANIPDIPVDAASIQSFIQQEPLVQEIDRKIASLVNRNLLVQPPSLKFCEQLSRTLNTIKVSKLQEVSTSLTKYSAAIPEFVVRCQQIWSSQVFTTPLPKGVSVLQLSLFLLSLQGKEVIEAHLAQMNFKIDKVKTEKQASVAQEIIAKYK